MPGRVKILSEKRVFDRFLKIDEITHTHETYSGPDSPKLVRFVMERGDSVAALVHDVENGEVLLAEQFRIATYRHGPGWIAETAAGAIEAQEDPEEAMRREILEELGYRVRRLSKIGLFYVSPGGASERIHLFYAKVRPSMLVDASASGAREEDEDIRTLRIPVKKFLLKINKMEIQDAKTLVAGQWLANRIARDELAALRAQIRASKAPAKSR